MVQRTFLQQNRVPPFLNSKLSKGSRLQSPNFFPVKFGSPKDFAKGPGALEKAVSDICYEVPGGRI